MAVTGRSKSLGVALIAAAVVMGILLVLVWHGPTQFLDAASYASVIDSIAKGNGLTTQLSPSFSTVSAANFVESGGRLDFVDFPAGYPLVAAPIAVVFGARSAMLSVGVISAGAAIVIIALGPRWASSSARMSVAHAVFGAALVLSPMYVAVVQAGLSEPMFISVLLAVALLSSRENPTRHELTWAVLLAGFAGAIRFVGAPVVVVPVLLLARSVGRRTAAWVGVIACLPWTANMLWSSRRQSGHQIGLRSIELVDVRLLSHSVLGWVDHRYGDFSSFFAADSWPPWWGTALAMIWLVVAALSIAGVLSRRHFLPHPVQICIAMAGVLTASLLTGMALFDSLVSPDNRLMLPAGMLTLTGLWWWAADRYWWRAVLPLLLGVVVFSSAPWNRERVAPARESEELLAAVDGAQIVISDNADAVWWQTGVPSAYLPKRIELLTGRPIDQAGVLEALPCALQQRGGMIIVLGGAFSDSSAVDELESLVDAGHLDEDSIGSIRRYLPGDGACDGGG